MQKVFFITATGTNIGKTFILENLCRKFAANNQKFFALKPIISGFDENGWNSNNANSDSAKILKALSKPLNQKNLDLISPWRFKAPLSPNIAAELENKEINFDEVVSFCQKHIKSAVKNNHYLLIEGAGGIMTPINNSKTFCDLISELKIPAILVIGNYLGTISHSLSAITTLQHYKIPISQIILNHQEGDETNYQDILKTLRNFTDLEIVTLGTT